MKKYKVNKRLVFQKLGKDALFFNNANSNLYTLNETAYLILRQITSGKSIQETAKNISANFDVEIKAAETDVLNTVKTLNQYKIVLPE